MPAKAAKNHCYSVVHENNGEIAYCTIYIAYEKISNETREYLQSYRETDINDLVEPKAFCICSPYSFCHEYTEILMEMVKLSTTTMNVPLEV